MIKKLKDKEMIETKTTKLGTLFTIINYAKYQDREAEKDKRIKELRTELEQQKNSRRTVILIIQINILVDKVGH
jgi:hypothetical protein